MTFMRVNTFGSLGLERDGAPALSAEPHASPRLAVLAMLAAASDQGVLPARFRNYLWPSHSDEAAAAELTTMLASLERDLGVPVAEQRGGAWHLSPDIGSDVSEFEVALRGGRNDVAVSIYGGPFLLGFSMGPRLQFDRWAEWERVRLAARYQEALDSLSGPPGGSRPRRTSERLVAIVGLVADKLRATPARGT